MPFIAAAVVGSAVIGGVSANKAAKAQGKAGDKASAVDTAMYDQTRLDQGPARTLGNSAIAQLGVGIGAPLAGSQAVPQSEENFDPGQYLLNNPDVAQNGKWQSDPWGHYSTYGKGENRTFYYTPEAQAQMKALSAPPGESVGVIGLGEFNKKFSLADFQEDPGYKFRLDQGTQALERSAAARGGLLSGGHLKDLTGYQQGMASQEYGNAYNRFNNDQSSRFNRLAAIAGIGQTANNTLATVGQNTANNVSNNLTGIGNAQAAGYIGTGNAINSGVGQGISAYQNNQLLKTLQPPKAA